MLVKYLVLILSIFFVGVKCNAITRASNTMTMKLDSSLVDGIITAGTSFYLKSTGPNDIMKVTCTKRDTTKPGTLVVLVNSEPIPKLTDCNEFVIGQNSENICYEIITQFTVPMSGSSKMDFECRINETSNVDNVKQLFTKTGKIGHFNINL